MKFFLFFSVSLIVSALIAPALFPGCTGSSKNAAPGGPVQKELFWRTEARPGGEYLVDRDGNAVPLKRYRRIVVLSPGAVETLYSIGGESAIAAITSTSDPVWPPEKTVLLPTVGNAARPSLEQVIVLEPDLVIGNGMNSAFIAELTGRGSAAIVHGADSMEDIFYSTRILGILCGREGEAEKLIAENRAALDKLAEELRRQPLKLKGAFLYLVHPVMAFTSDSLAGNVLSLLGAENIAADLPAEQPILSPEYILAQNPDFIFGAMSITNEEDILTADSVILRTRAGREGNISIIPSSFFLRPSLRIVDKILELHGEMQKYKQ